MTDLTDHDEVIAREAWETERTADYALSGASSWAWEGLQQPIRCGFITAARLGRERTPPALSSPEHDEALIAEAMGRCGYKSPTVMYHTIARELLAMARSGWTPEPHPDEKAVRAILGAWAEDSVPRTDDPDFQAALAAYRQAKRGEG